MSHEADDIFYRLVPHTSDLAWAEEVAESLAPDLRRAKAEAWDEGCAVAHGYDLSHHLDREEFEDLTKGAPFINPYRGDQ